VQANIRSVTVQGDEQDRDADLDPVQQFEVVTDSGHRYVVVLQAPPVGSRSDWDVTSSGLLQSHVFVVVMVLSRGCCRSASLRRHSSSKRSHAAGTSHDQGPRDTHALSL
jgi:hypothetical protein